MQAMIFKRFLQLLTSSKDLSIGILLIITIMLMILPMPTGLVDTLIGLNFGIAVLLLMTAVYLGSPLQLSSLPGIILISTIFRLALSVTTTRLILSEGNAGAIVDTFGAFVIAGNVVVGMVVFFIVTIVQFIVIAKGSERIAEVGARFTLDALPGKQMSIDAELRNGDIDNQEAGHRRSLLQRESQFYGAMDGAMKFVKGDAIAGLIIISVNLIGGLTIGMVQLGMSFGEAGLKYSLLTVGDALISQIPALLISITAATIVTRVQGDTQRNLGSDIVAQLMSDKRAMRMAALTVCGMGLLPGFPTVILLILGGLFGLASILIDRKQPQTIVETDIEETAILTPQLPDQAPVVMMISGDLADQIDQDNMTAPILVLRNHITQTVGLTCPALTMKTNTSLPSDCFQIMIDDVPVLRDTLQAGRIYVDDCSEFIALVDVPSEQITTSDGKTLYSVDAGHEQTMIDADLLYCTAENRLLEALENAVFRNFSSFVGIQETQAMLSELGQHFEALRNEVQHRCQIQQIADVLRRLVQEQIFPTNKRQFLEALAEWASPEQTGVTLTEYVRVSLSKKICHRVADQNGTISAVVLERDTEVFLRDCLRDTNVGPYLVLDDRQSDLLLAEIRKNIKKTSGDTKLVLMTSMDVRRHLKTFLTRNNIDVDVLSFQELADGFTAIPIATLTIGDSLPLNEVA
ncbi:type III secretion system export apparatus subunit SctV [Parasulfitobacter algicola]|uniref:Type III secretion system export apparatus subunit SctV n=1 Tax=Parasulfitobacter algicola TaxID=2614809 RepID=A0ABX2J0U7_9RHOB|nr:type III secretion system export apparatus subunit SctV [Sulfitobacter algicola]NSX56773.1 type III secretion system export apparatus subunit SctV [Sulfitobacter algicola]